MLTRIAAVISTLLFIGSCSADQAARFDEASFSQYTEFDGPAFRPIESVDAVEIVWIESRGQGGPFTLTWPDGRCPQAEDRERCVDLIEVAAAAIAEQDFEDRTAANVFGVSGCPMCPSFHGYVFIVEGNTARPVGQNEAVRALGLIDAPGEAIVVLGEPAQVRSIEDGFELVTSTQACNPEGPERTLWTVAADGKIARGASWMENSGYDCSDD